MGIVQQTIPFMKTKRILFFLFLPLLLDVFIVGCCDCPPTEYFDYSNCSLQVENLDNAGPNAIIATKDTVLKEAYGIQLTIERSEGICHHQNLPLFSSSAYALTKCKCDYEVYDYLDSASSISIFTVNDFDQDHPSNSDITEYFKTGSFTEVNSSLPEINQTLYNNYNRDSIENLDFNVFLFTAPISPGNHQFKIEIAFTNGKTLEATTPNIYLK